MDICGEGVKVMTAEEREIVINNLKKMVKYHGMIRNIPCRECVQVAEMAIKALEERPTEDYESMYMTGHEDGYKAAILDMAKNMKEMKWYGGDYKKERAAGVPEHYASGAGGGT